MLANQTVESLRRMKLTGMAEAFLAQGQDPGCRELSFEERFGLLVDQESTYREDRRLKRLLRGAHLKTQACVEDIDYSHSRGLDRAVMASLSSCQWARDRRNILVTGPTGVGKTFICCALGNLACRNVIHLLVHLDRARQLRMIRGFWQDRRPRGGVPGSILCPQPTECLQ